MCQALIFSHLSNGCMTSVNWVIKIFKEGKLAVDIK
jgi:hypothetical protein